MLFFCPTKYEVPRLLRDRTEVFGMGPSAGRRLAGVLNQMNTKETFLIYGCAGALQPGFHPGDVYFISELFVDGRWERIGPRNLGVMAPVASLFSSEVVLKTPAEKKRLHEETGANLVDQEMGAIWMEASPEVRSRLIFIRGVIDSVGSDVSFLDFGHVQWLKLLDFAQASNFCLFVVDYFRYRRGIDSFFRGDITTYYGDIGPQLRKAPL